MERNLFTLCMSYYISSLQHFGIPGAFAIHYETFSYVLNTGSLGQISKGKRESLKLKAEFVLNATTLKKKGMYTVLTLAELLQILSFGCSESVKAVNKTQVQ